MADRGRAWRLRRAARGRAAPACFRSAFIVAVAAYGHLSGTAIAQQASDLEQLRESIEETREKVVGFEREERSLLARLEEIDRRRADLKHSRRGAEAESRRARAAVVALQPELDAAREKLAATRSALSRRAVALYKAGAIGPVRILFSADSLPEMMGRAKALRTLLVHDAELVDRHTAKLNRVTALELELMAAADRRDRAVARLAAIARELGAERKTKKDWVARVHEDRGSARALLVELEQSARALEETLSGLEGSSATQTRVIGDGIAALKGLLLPPVDGVIVQGFGRVVDEEFKTETFRKGVEFIAAEGDSVRAIGSGQVRYSGWFRGYGKLVIIDHGDEYFSVSGHLDEVYVDVGSAVKAGDTLGTVGETGSLRGPALYFEVRHAGTPLDPAEWLSLGSPSG